MHQQRQRVLLVDGDIGRAERLTKRLEHLDFDIEVVDNGAAALLRAHEDRPDVVVSSTSLPILNGFLLLEALRSEAATCRVPVILITEGTSPDEVARAWKAGADLCVPRNQGEADVLATLHRALTSIVSRPPAAGCLALAS